MFESYIVFYENDVERDILKNLFVPDKPDATNKISKEDWTGYFKNIGVDIFCV